MTFLQMYYAECLNCGDTCDRAGLTREVARRLATNAGWQAWETQWIHGGIPVDWDFHCPTHRTDLG